VRNKKKQSEARTKRSEANALPSCWLVGGSRSRRRQSSLVSQFRFLLDPLPVLSLASVSLSLFLPLHLYNIYIILSVSFVLPRHEQYKAKGNAALQAGNTSEAIENYTKAINLDGANHVYYSNRSAAYLKAGDANNALEDANACIGLNPDSFSKGYSRKGAALHALKRYNDSIAAYEEGLSKFPDDAALAKGLADAKRDKDNPFGAAARGGGGPGIFGPQMLAQMALDPRFQTYLDDPDVMAKIKAVQTNPNMLPAFFQDTKFRELMELLMGKDGSDDGEGDSSDANSNNNDGGGASDHKSKKKEPEKEVKKEQDLSHLSPDERAAIGKKEEGNELYKKKQFAEAIAAYDEAIKLDPKNMTFHSNKAAVYLQEKKYDDCIASCLKAVEVGKEHMAAFEDRAKAYTRAAKACQKKGDLGQAIEYCKEAQLEAFDKQTQRLLKTLELEKKKSDALAYQSDDLAEEAKQRGNDHFRKQEWPQAVQAYEEAVKRAPKNAPIRNNLAAALCKIMDFSGAQRQIGIALELDPKYVKAWARKGDIEMYMKEYHKALESYKEGLELDGENSACREGLKKCMVAISYGRQTMTDAEKKEQAAHAMADPEIQAILQDPVTQQILRDFSENPAAAQQAMGNPMVRAKIEKLIAAGIIETG